MLLLKCRGFLDLNVASILYRTLSYVTYCSTWELLLVLALQRWYKATGKCAFKRWRKARVPNPR